jgi:hypothetical protein
VQQIRLQRPPAVQIQVNKPRTASAPTIPCGGGTRIEPKRRTSPGDGSRSAGGPGMGRAEANDDVRATHAFQREFIPPHAIARVDSAICTDTGAQSNCHKAAAKSPQAPRQAALIEQSAKTPKKNVTSRAATKGSGLCNTRSGAPGTPAGANAKRHLSTGNSGGMA